MNKNNLLVLVLALAVGVLGAYFYKTKMTSVSPEQQNQNWNDEWSKKAPNTPTPAPEQKPEVSPPVGKPSSYEEAITFGRTARKPVLLIFGAKWCGYCRDLKDQTLPSPEVQAELANFIVYEIDVDAERALASKFNVKSLPAYKIVGDAEQTLAEGIGFKKPKEFVAWLRSGITKIRPLKS